MAISGAEERQSQQPGLFRKLLSEPHEAQLVEVINTGEHLLLKCQNINIKIKY